MRRIERKTVHAFIRLHFDILCSRCCLWCSGVFAWDTAKLVHIHLLQLQWFSIHTICWRGWNRVFRIRFAKILIKVININLHIINSLVEQTRFNINHQIQLNKVCNIRKSLVFGRGFVVVVFFFLIFCAHIFRFGDVMPFDYYDYYHEQSVTQPKPLPAKKKEIC